MKKRVILSFVIALFMVCFFAISISAATTNEFGTLETSTTIDLTGMATDSDVYCVLYDGTEYHTYPSQYIVKNTGDFAYDFSKINAAFTGKSYDNHSVIRIEIPSHVTNIPASIFGYGKSKSLQEVSFPEDSQLKTLAWGAFENCTTLQKITLPHSLESIGNNCFNGCSALSSVNFDLDGNLKTLDDKTFSSCDSLTEMVLPRNLEKIGANTFYGSDNISKIVLSPKLTKVTGKEIISALGYNVKDYLLEMYMPGDFATAEGSVESGAIFCRSNSGDLKRYVIFVTGTKKQVEDFVKKYSEDTKIVDANIVAYDPEKGNNAESYLGLDAYTTEKTINTNHVFVYGYNACKAFYNDEHSYGTEQEKFLGAEYLTDYVIATTCQRCNENVIKETVATAIFTNKGYSYASYGTGKSFTFGISLNEQSYSDYIAHNPDANIKFGFIIGSVESDDNQILNADGTSKLSNYIITDFTDTNYQSLNRYDLIMHGIGDDDVEMQFYCGAYVIEDSSIYYIGNTTTTKAVPITYDKLPVVNS